MSCIMRDCPNSKYACKQLNFFKLPHTDEKRKEWLDVCKPECGLSKCPVVCANHFLPSQISVKGQRARLCTDAVPMPFAIVKEDRSEQGNIPILESRQKLDVRQKKFRTGLTEFELEPDDDYDVRCGEVFLTYSGVLVFHCSPCNKKYGNVIHFLKHLSVHYEHIKEELIYKEYETKEIENIKKSASLDNITCEEEIEIKVEDEREEMQEFMKIEIQPTMLQTPHDPISEIEQILIEETSHCKDTDIEYENLSGEEKTVDGFYALSSKDKFEDELQKEPSTTQKIRQGKYKKHATVKVHKCNICNKEFLFKERLKKHYIIHSEERKYKCHICNFAFKDNSNLRAHLKRHTKQKKISCDTCSKKFFTRSEARQHERYHTGERPYVCSTCGFAFTTSGALTLHAKRHNSEPTYKCNHCIKGFYARADLRDHMLVHTKEKPFVCHICGASFPRYKSMLRHTKLHAKAS